MAAFRASRLVCLAISGMLPTMAPMRWLWLLRSLNTSVMWTMYSPSSPMEVFESSMLCVPSCRHSPAWRARLLACCMSDSLSAMARPRSARRDSSCSRGRVGSGVTGISTEGGGAGSGSGADWSTGISITWAGRWW
ncbi:hypothetical protein D9M71_757500 [compost metagenome]